MTIGQMKAIGPRLLAGRDPSPVEVLNPNSDFPVVLLCEHAGQCVPERLDGLGIGRDDLDAHIGWDIGAAAVTRHLAELLGAPALLQNFSRLVIDCNRPPEAPDSIPEASDGVTIPANRGLDPADRQARIDEVFWPFHEAVDGLFDRADRLAAFSVHSFTPVMDGIRRPWELSFLYRKDKSTSEALRALVRAQRPEMEIGMNQPYQIEDASDWFVPRHGEARGLAHSLIEIRNDLISHPDQQRAWAVLLAKVILEFLKDKEK
ncbi:N-formylglutamate amidohydrolase [Roseibium sp.]|uniref:N-formylglutamate amidohydrolase n=1 Tax=Roseibium sp. TaxID=1936156 RepID=UPI003D0B9CF4